MRSIVFSVVCGLGLTWTPSVGAALAQRSGGLGASPLQQQSTQPTPLSRSGAPSLDGRNGSVPEDPNAAVRQAQMARLQNNDRQKRIVDDAAKLLRLATELKAEVDKSNKDQMSLDVIRKADEVEHLAHDVKIRMRG